MRKFLLPAVLSALILLISGCSTGDDAVAQGGNTFQFVSPGGQTVITYEPADRKPIAGLEGEDLVSGQPLALSDARFADKVVVINVWGSWCGPCRGEADDLERVYEDNRDDGVEFLGINLRDDRDSAKDFVIDRKVGFPSIYDFPGLSLAALTTPDLGGPDDDRPRPAAPARRGLPQGRLRQGTRRGRQASRRGTGGFGLMTSSTVIAASIGDTFADTVTSGPLLLALAACLLAGLVSFASPCVVPLVPRLSVVSRGTGRRRGPPAVKVGGGLQERAFEGRARRRSVRARLHRRLRRGHRDRPRRDQYLCPES